MVDVVGRDVGQVCVGGVALDVELVDEVIEDGVLLSGVRGFSRAVWAGGKGGARLRPVVGSVWGGDCVEEGNSTEERSEEEEELHYAFAAI